MFLLDTGLRMKEALHLEWPNVRLDPAAGASLGYLRVAWQTSKGPKSRNVPLTERARLVLIGRGPRKDGFVFNRDGQPLYQTWVNQRHSESRKLLKLTSEFVPHTFRHTYGTRLGEAGADAFTIMKLMGHSSVTVSQRYVHPTPETLERAVDRLQKLNQAGVVEEPAEQIVPKDSPKVESRRKRDVQ